MNERENGSSREEPQAGADGLQEILRERARILSEVPALEESGEKISVLSFQLREELYAVELVALTEMRRAVPLRHLPSAPPHLVGIINLRGELLPAVDLCPILGLPQHEWREVAPALLILSSKGNKLALVVDEARDILTFPLKELKPPPLSLEQERILFLRGELLLDDRPISLLDVEKLLQDPRLTGETG